MNGKQGDNPVTDMLHYGKHPFPPEIERLLLKVNALDPQLTNFLDVWAWERGEHIEQGILDMEEMLRRFPAEGLDYLEQVAEWQTHPVRKHNYKLMVKFLRNPDAKRVEPDHPFEGEPPPYRDPSDIVISSMGRLPEETWFQKKFGCWGLVMIAVAICVVLFALLWRWAGI